LALQQYEAAKKDFEYFSRLPRIAIAYWKEEIKETGNEGIPGPD